MIRRPPRSTLSLHDALPISGLDRRVPNVRKAIAGVDLDAFVFAPFLVCIQIRLIIVAGSPRGVGLLYPLRPQNPACGRDAQAGSGSTLDKIPAIDPDRKSTR